MKVYKVVTHYELEKSTMDGWELDKVLTHSFADKVSCQVPIANHVPDGCYGNVTQYPRDEVIQVHAPLFVLVKEKELINKEFTLKLDNETLRHNLEVMIKERKQWEHTAESLQRQFIASQEANQLALKHRDEYQAQAQKLERDIAKLRIALGDLRMKEILDGT